MAVVGLLEGICIIHRITGTPYDGNPRFPCLPTPSEFLAGVVQEWESHHHKVKPVKPLEKLTENVVHQVFRR